MCQLRPNGAHVFSAVSGENQLQRLYFSADRTFSPWTKYSLFAVKKPVSECFLHPLSQKSCPLNIHVVWGVTDILEGRSFFMSVVKKSKNRLLDPEDRGTTLIRNVDNCESTQRNIVKSAAITSNLASCTLYQHYTQCHD